MVENWLKYTPASPCPYSFNLINVTEKCNCNEDIKSYVSKKVIESYRNLDFLKMTFKEEPEEELRKYIVDYVLPSAENQISKNVKQGDVGEILANIIVTYFGKLFIPISKLRWKFNSERSVFCTDMIAHNANGKITDIYYYEIKTRLSINKESINGKSNYVTINAHNSLVKDMKAPNESIADFLSRYYYEKADFEKAATYSEIVKKPNNFNKYFELFFIIEKSNYISDILDELNNLPPTLTPLNTTVVLIENLRSFISEISNIAVDEAIKYVYEK